MTVREITTRRVWLRVLAVAVVVASGCGTRADTGRSDEATSTTQQTKPPAETTATATTTAADTATRTDTATATETTPTPPLNTTDLAVTRLFGHSDDRDHSIGSGSVIADEFPAVRLVTDRAGWQAVRREIEAAAETAYDGLPIAEKTAFETECLVVLQTLLRGGANRLRLSGMTRDGTETVRLRVEELSRGGPNNQPTRLLLVRIPDAEHVARVVVRYVFEGNAVTVETETSQGQSTARRLAIETNG